MRAPGKALASATLAVAVALVLAACVTTKEAQQRAQRAEQIHAGAPAWFQEYWRKYEVDRRGQYGIMALDRQGRAAAYYYCTTNCHNANMPQLRAWMDVNFKHAALDQCRQHVRENNPGQKPACAVYAIKGEIVWKGALPWGSS